MRFRLVALVHVVSTWFMVGMIWTIHLVHYPLFSAVGPESYVDFQAEHVDRIGTLLFVPWMVEGLSLLALMWAVFRHRQRDIGVAVAVNAVAMAIILVISAFWSAPAHADLADGFDAAVHDRLMTANLIRTLAWTVSGICAAWLAWVTFVSARSDSSRAMAETV